MSLILDALRRRSADRGGDDSSDGTARADAVPATLGYARPKQGVSLRTLFLYGVAAVLIGFVGLTLVIAVLAPSAPPAPRLAPRRVGAARLVLHSGCTRNGGHIRHRAS